jgi:hypothetical protein
MGVCKSHFVLFHKWTQKCKILIKIQVIVYLALTGIMDGGTPVGWPVGTRVKSQLCRRGCSFAFRAKTNILYTTKEYNDDNGDIA